MQFWKRWNYPACVGAIDGKHVRIMKPPSSGSTFFNYKNFFSIILMAVVNGNYEILYASVGAEGKTADGGCWTGCDFYKALVAGRLNLPPNVILQNGVSIPCHFVSDDAFAMTPTVLKPYPNRLLTKPERVYNYRLSRARRVVENVFGIISSRFQVLRSEIRLNVKHATNVVLAICVLHNVLRRKCGNCYMPPGSYDADDVNYELIPGDWRGAEELPGLPATAARNPAKVAKAMRNNLTGFFMTNEGSVPWQDTMIETDVTCIVSTLS